MTIDVSQLDTPIGTLTLYLRQGRLCAAGFAEQVRSLDARLAERFGSLALRPSSGGAITEQVRAYFAGKLDALDGLEIDAGGTAFQRRVWSALTRLAPGETRSYGQLARELDLPAGAARAVGGANALNPVCVIVPCHRVIASSGALSGYAGGVARKRWLLEHERRHAALSA
jgi:methylated-DNA-[protein]-cysteine S-methyltransferase